MNRLHILIGAAPRSLTDAALVVLRMTLGAVFLAHGWDAHRMGLGTVVAMQRSIGIPLPEVSGPVMVYVELIGGALLVFGALTRLIAVALVGIMIGAWIFVHAAHGIFVENGGYELVMVLAVASALLAVAGPGRFSVDHLLVERVRQTDASQAHDAVGGRA
ncbi:MAG: DoxX family membrane protein [Actinophytocola sp.]|nr:DoxX family membrane protein [Actinophytocola sp.]